MPGTGSIIIPSTGDRDSSPMPIIEYGSGAAAGSIVGFTLAPVMIASAESWPVPGIGTLLNTLALVMVASGESWPTSILYVAATNTLALVMVASGESWPVPGIDGGAKAASYATKLGAVVDQRRLRAKVQVHDVGGTWPDGAPGI